MLKAVVNDAVRAVLNGVTIADSDDIVVVEGNAYFPMDAVQSDCLAANTDIRPTYCHWKGIATYFDVSAGGETNAGGAWHYAAPYAQSAVIAGRIAFWNGIEIIGKPPGAGLVEGEPSLDGKTGWEALCWIIKFSEQPVISAAEVEAVTGIPALRGQVDGVKRRIVWRPLLVGMIGVPVPCADGHELTVCAYLRVATVQRDDVGVVRQPQGGQMLRHNFAEHSDEVQKLRRRQVLVTDDQNDVLDEGRFQVRRDARVNQLGKVQSRDLNAKGPGKGREGRLHDRLLEFFRLI